MNQADAQARRRRAQCPRWRVGLVKPQMSQFARVTSIDALREFRAALIEFADTGRSALGEALSEVQRTVWWIQNEMRDHWQRELKQRSNKLAEARTDLARAQMQQRSDVTERKAVQAAVRRVEEAEEKLRQIKKWSTEMERQQMLFRGQCSQLSGSLDGELPKTIAWMERMIDSLQQYVSLQAPLTEPPPGISEVVTSEAAPGEAVSNEDSSVRTANPSSESEAAP
jgi:hypothetical protein